MSLFCFQPHFKLCWQPLSTSLTTSPRFLFLRTITLTVHVHSTQDCHVPRSASAAGRILLRHPQITVPTPVRSILTACLSLLLPGALIPALRFTSLEGGAQLKVCSKTTFWSTVSPRWGTQLPPQNHILPFHCPDWWYWLCHFFL